MKKSERIKIKIGVIRKLKTNLTHIKEGLKMEWRYRHSDGYTEAIKIDLAKISSTLFALRAAEKQIPMPLRTHAELLPFRNFNNSRCYLCLKNYFCQNCNKKILRFEGYGIKFCPHCGQKLWWPKN